MQQLPYDPSLPGAHVNGWLVVATLLPLAVALLALIAVCWRADRAWTRRSTMPLPSQPSHDRLLLSLAELTALADLERAAALDDRRLAKRLSGRARRPGLPRLPRRPLGAIVAPLAAGFTLGTFTWSTPLAFLGVVAMGAGAAAFAVRPPGADAPAPLVEAPAGGATSI